MGEFGDFNLEELSQLEQESYIIDELFTIALMLVVAVSAYLLVWTQSFVVLYAAFFAIGGLFVGFLLLKRPILYKSIFSSDGGINFLLWVVAGTFIVRVATTFILLSYPTSFAVLNDTGLESLIGFVQIVVLAPFTESILIHWVVQGWAESFTNSRFVGVVVAVAFAVIYHIPRYGASPAHLVSVLFAFSMFCASYAVSRRLSIPIAFHSLVNFFG